MGKRPHRTSDDGREVSQQADRSLPQGPFANSEPPKKVQHMNARSLVSLCAALATSLLFAVPACAEKLSLVGGTVINPADGRIIENALLIIDGGKIESIGSGKEKEIPPGSRRIECKGKFIIPGLWDMHVHLAGVTADPKWSKHSLLPLLIANGITGVRDMGGNLDALLSWRREIEAGTLVGPRIFAAGPFLADGKPGTPDTLLVANPEQAHQAVREVKSRHGDFVKVLSKLSRESYFAIADEAKEQGLDFVGHVPDSISATDASNAGQKSIEHIMYSNLAFDCSSQETELRQKRADAALKRDSPGMGKIRDRANATFDPKKADALWQTFIRNKTWMVPTLIGTYTLAHQLEAAMNVNDPRLAFLPPALRAQWSAEAIAKDVSAEVAKWYGEQFDFDLKLARAMHSAGVPMLAGSDSLDPLNYPGSSLHEELKLLVRAGFSPMEALQAATINPARFLGRDNAGGFGTLEPGRLADIVVLDANPLAAIANTQRISAVIINGRLLDRAELNRLLDEARSASHD
jgi:imidazolonepropionase-like amidohydrolase